MKKLLFGFVFISIMSCSISDSTKKPKVIEEKETHNLDWLLGSWERTNDKEGRKTYEVWEKKSALEYSGLGFTLASQDTVFKELMSIKKINDNWQFIVSGVNETPTPFIFTNQTKLGFICENEKNEFPKIIEYQFDDNKLKAKISGGEMVIPFEFVKNK